MTLTASATSTVTGRSPQEVIEFVLDLEQYRRIDTKILRVFSIEGPDDEGNGSARILGRMRWTPPAPDVQDFSLERWQRLTFRGGARQPGRAVFNFTGTFECNEVAEGTEFTHAYVFDFTPPFRWLERVHRGSFTPDLRDEVDRLATHLST